MYTVYVMSQIYFNHIPRTGGTYINFCLHEAGIKNIQNNNEPIKILQPGRIGKESGITPDDIMNSNFIIGHFATLPNLIIPNLKTVSILRDPVKRVVSEFSMFYYLQTELNKKHDDLFFQKFENNKIEMFKYWYREKNNQNIQSNNLLNPIFYGVYVNDGTSLGICEESLWNKPHTKDVNFNDIKNAINNLSVVGVNEKINNFINDFFTLINKEFNANIVNPEIQDIFNSTKISKEIYDSLDKDIINDIININNIDFQAWEYAKSLVD